jgi:hypothetical protein
MIIHTQGDSREENFLLAAMINDKFGMNSTVIPHKNKKKYFVISIPSYNYLTLRNLIKPHMIEYFAYKIPRA